MENIKERIDLRIRNKVKNGKIINLPTYELLLIYVSMIIVSGLAWIFIFSPNPENYDEVSNELWEFVNNNVTKEYENFTDNIENIKIKGYNVEIDFNDSEEQWIVGISKESDALESQRIIAVISRNKEESIVYLKYKTKKEYINKYTELKILGAMVSTVVEISMYIVIVEIFKLLSIIFSYILTFIFFVKDRINKKI